MARNPASGLSERQERILLGLCRQYAIDGRPVASGTLCSSLGLEWSSATIRNELAALERAGLVHKPHAASGRVPTAEGWQIYIESVPRGRTARPEHKRLLDVGLRDPIDPRQGLRSAARVLAELAGCVAIGFVGEARPGVVRAVELVPLTNGGEPARVIVMLGLEDGASSVRTIEIARSLLERDGNLRRTQDLLRELTIGRSLEQAGDHLRELLEQQEARVDLCLAEALRIGLLLCAASFDPLWMQVAGQGTLARDVAREGLIGPSGPKGSALDPAMIGDLLEVLEDYQHLAEILCQLLPEPGEAPQASVRLDVSLEAWREGLGPARDQAAFVPSAGLTLVGCRLRWPSNHDEGRTTGAVALLGSPRMDYEAVIPLVEYAARAMVVRG